MENSLTTRRGSGSLYSVSHLIRRLQSSVRTYQFKKGREKMTSRIEEEFIVLIAVSDSSIRFH